MQGGARQFLHSFRQEAAQRPALPSLAATLQLDLFVSPRTLKPRPLSPNGEWMTAVAAKHPAATPWIVGPIGDVAFVAGAPILCAALLLPLSRVISTQTLWVVVMAFGAVGHHLPGFVRAYGDAELFERFRLRFLLAPPIALVASVGFGYFDLHGLALVSLAWSAWHGMMQHFGFMRIYDAKSGAPTRVSGRLDLALSASFFGWCLLASPHQSASLFDPLLRAGVWPLSPPLVAAVSSLTAANHVGSTVVVTSSMRSPGTTASRGAPRRTWSP